VFLSATAAFGAPSLTQTAVFVSGKDGYHTFRIPAIETAPDGSLIVFAEARKYTAEDPGFGRQDIDLVCKRSTDNGVAWSPMAILEDHGEEWSAANPATIVDRTDGKLWVFYIRGRPKRSSETSRPGTVHPRESGVDRSRTLGQVTREDIERQTATEDQQS